MLVVLSALVSLVSGVIVLWANPRRFPNQVFSISSLLMTVWLALVYKCASVGPHAQEYIALGFPWHRANAAVGAFFPWSVWLLKESVVAANGEKLRTIRRSLPLLVAGGFLVPLSYADSFIFVNPLTGVWERGTPYLVYNGFAITAAIILILQAFFEIRVQTGLRRIEMRFLALNMGIAWLLIIAAASIGNLLHLPVIKSLIFFVAIGAFALSGWTVATYRIFDARQVYLALAQRVVLAFAFCLVIFGFWHLSEELDERRPAPLIVGLALCTSAAFWLDRKSREWLDLGGERILAETRRAVIGFARTEFHPDELVGCFEKLLRGQCLTASATLLFDRGEVYAAGELEFAKDRPGYRVLCENGWTTPESLSRRRSIPGLADLRRFLADRSLGLVVAVPHGSLKPSLLVALGTKTTQWPFTYPEVQRLQNLAELMDNILTHSRLTLQATQQARMGYLALMSRGLAIPITAKHWIALPSSISEFLLSTHSSRLFPLSTVDTESAAIED